MSRFAGLLTSFLLLWANASFAVDPSGKYIGAAGVVTVHQSPSSQSLMVEIQSHDKACLITTDMRLVKNGKPFQLLSHDLPIRLNFTRKGMVMEKGDENIPEECMDFNPATPFKRQ